MLYIIYRKSRMIEGQFINKSIFYLDQVLKRLSSTNTSSSNTMHIPYRSSSITKLLKNTLVGNNHTNILICINPSSKYINNTINTMSFALKTSSYIKYKNDTYNNALYKSSSSNIYIQSLMNKISSLEGEVLDLRQQIKERDSIIQNQVHNNISNEYKIEADDPISDIYYDVSESDRNQLEMIVKSEGKKGGRRLIFDDEDCAEAGDAGVEGANFDKENRPSPTYHILGSHNKDQNISFERVERVDCMDNKKVYNTISIQTETLKQRDTNIDHRDGCVSDRQHMRVYTKDSKHDKRKNMVNKFTNISSQLRLLYIRKPLDSDSLLNTIHRSRSNLHIK